MSASTYTEAVINCDFPGCVQVGFASHFELAINAHADDVRGVLRRRGWAVNLPADPGTKPRRDLCPEHKEASGETTS